jgi:hypothetical protein
MTDESYRKLRALQEALARYQGLSGSTAVEANGTTPVNTSRELVLCTNVKSTPREIHDETRALIRETILRQCVVRSSEPRELTVGLDSKFSTSTNWNQKMRSYTAGGAKIINANILLHGAFWLLNKIVFKRKREIPTVDDISVEYFIRRALNTLMEEAVDHYNNQEYAIFIQKLSEPYYQKRKLMDTKFGRESISIEIRVDQIIQPLLKHGFRADKIAHLIILIGEVLLRGIDFKDPERTNPEHTALLEQSKILFQGAYESEELNKAAVKLDERVKKYHQQKIMKYAKQFLDPISKTDIEDSRTAPYINRLASFCKVARLNYAIACLLAGGK